MEMTFNKNQFYQTIYNIKMTNKAKNIMMYLLQRANINTGDCFPSKNRMAKECAISLSTVSRALRELTKLGLIIKHFRYRQNGGQSSNLYEINVNVDAEKINNEISDKKENRNIDESVDNTKKENKFIRFMKKKSPILKGLTWGGCQSDTPRMKYNKYKLIKRDTIYNKLLSIYNSYTYFDK